jgi:hypothetical protein
VCSSDLSSSEPLNQSPKIRLVCEGPELSFSFPGKFNGLNEVEVTIPPMQGRITEGKYHTKLETILDDKYFVPLQFDAVFEMSTKVMAEIVTKKDIKNNHSNKIEASIIETKEISKRKISNLMPEEKQKIISAPKVIENPKESHDSKSKIRSLKERFKSL